MFWIIITVLLGIVFWGGIIYWAFMRKTPDSGAGWGIATAVITAVVWVFISFGMSIHAVGNRQVAIVYDANGTISHKENAGWVTIKPWMHIKTENIGIQHEEFDLGADNAAVSKDQQQIYAKLFLNYRIEPEHVVTLYKDVGSSWKTILLDARVLQDFKEITATFTTPEITANREKLRVLTKQRLQEELDAYDITVVDVFVKNLSFSQSYTDAIERKQKQVQDALTAQAKVAQVTAEANQKVAQAKGEATANIERAKGDATSNRLRQRSLTNKLIQWEAIQKLNPNVQIIVCPPASVCIPNSGIIPAPTGN